VRRREERRGKSAVTQQQEAAALMKALANTLLKLSIMHHIMHKGFTTQQLQSICSRSLMILS
jgi:hypothetical protein